MKTQAVIFDLYDTLVFLPSDSKPFHRIAAASKGTNKFGLAMESLTSDFASLADFARYLGVDSIDDFGPMESELELDLSVVELFKDVKQTLEELSDLGIKLAVISNLATPYITPFYELGLNQFIPITVFSCECRLRKPNPDIYQLCLQKLGCLPSETLMVGDSLTADVRGPQKVGIKGIHLLRNGETSQAELSIPSLDRLKPIVLKHM